jgi:CHAD domain-containing protein
MEIEAKLAIPNRRAYRALLHLRSLAGYELREAGSMRVHDQYVDTADGRLLAAGYACRLRSAEDGLLLTVKGLGGAEGAVHRRAHHEMRLPAWSSKPADWPDGDARDTVLELAAGAMLEPLVDLVQRRVFSDVMDGERLVGEFSLDAVRTEAGGRPASYHELEIELAEAGTEADLARLVEELIKVWDLAPEPRSKFERALELLRQSGSASQGLTPAERAALQDLSEKSGTPPARWAAVILAWDEGLPTRAIVARTGLSSGRVRYWVRTFRSERMAIFEQAAALQAGEEVELPQPAPTPAMPVGEVEPPQQAPAPAAPVAEAASRDEARPPAKVRTPKPKKRGGLPRVVDFCQEHGVDMDHAHFIESQALFLFDALRPVHKLPNKRRRLLRQAALLNTIGATTDSERPYRAGRDLILAQPLHDVSTADRLALACIVALGRNKVRPEREPTMAALEDAVRPQILPLTALLRIAEALDFSRSCSSAIQSLAEVTAERCVLTVDGPHAEMDALQAAGRVDLWDNLFGQELVFVAALPPVAAVENVVGRAPLPSGVQPAEATSPAAPPAAPILPDDPMAEAGRKVIYVHFTRMLANEAGTRLGEDPEALHDMRVATRRMRAAFALFEPYFEPKVMAPFAKGLRRTGRTLGAVRDLDVLLDKAVAYGAALPPENAGALEPLLVHWRTRREVARRQMLEYLDSPTYRRFADDFEVFLLSPGAGAVPPPADEIKPYQVRHLVPRLVLGRYEAVRAYEVVMPGAPLITHHMLRIDCKRLRYALEFFRGVLGTEAPALIKQVTAMQDLLGELQDAHVAEALLEEFLGHYRRKHKREPGSNIAGVQGYLEAQRAIQGQLLGQFPEPWAALIGPDFRRALVLTLAAL